MRFIKVWLLELDIVESDEAVLMLISQLTSFLFVVCFCLVAFLWNYFISIFNLTMLVSFSPVSLMPSLKMNFSHFLVIAVGMHN